MAELGGLEEALVPEIEFFGKEVVLVGFEEFFHAVLEVGDLAVETGGAIGLPGLLFGFGEGVGEVAGFVVKEEFGEAGVGEVGMEIGEFVGSGVADGVAMDAVGVAEEAVVEGGFGVDVLPLVFGGVVVVELIDEVGVIVEGLEVLLDEVGI